jgi:hypothetical protein
MKTRITGPAGSCYHVFSRIVERRFYLGDLEKEAFRSLLWRAADFSGVTILTYCVMDNHFHILVQVPEKKEVSDGEMLRRLKVLYGTGPRKGVFDPVGDFIRSKDHPALREKLRKKYLRRMYDLSEFMRTLKLRYSFWFNRNHDREGALWDARFKSVLVQGPQTGRDHGTGNLALSTVAAYIDLNSVRAGLVDDPLDYRWCGYAEAAAGANRAQMGFRIMYGIREGSLPNWQAVHEFFRSAMLLKEPELKHAAIIPPVALLRHRARCFTRGAIIGSRAFVEESFLRNRPKFSAKRATGARKIRDGIGVGIYAARQVD